MPLNPLTPRVGYGFNHLVTQICCMPTLWELLQITLWLVNTDLDSFPKKNLSAHAVIILLNQEDIFFIIVWGLMGIGIWEETLLAILSCSW